MADQPLNDGADATLDAAGNGTAVLQVPALETWHLTRVAVSATSNTSEPEARVYIGSVIPSNLLGGTYSGSLDSSDETQDVQPGQRIYCVWSGGDPGASATLSVFGTKTVAG